MEIGLYTFGELSGDPASGWGSQPQRMRQLIEEVRLADEVGLDVFGIGEHHRDRKSTRLNSSHSQQSRMPSSA